MKHKHNLLFLCALLFFNSCFEITEEFTITGSGSGEYAMKIDMFKMIGILAELGDSAKAEDNVEMNEARDTTIYFKRAIDESAGLTGEEKNLLHDGHMQMRMALAEKDFFFRFVFPFSKAADMGRIYNLTPQAMNCVNYESLDGKEEKEGSDMQMKPSAEMASANPYFEILAGKDYFEKRIKREEWKKFMKSDSTFSELTNMLSGSTYMVTKINLPRPVKKCDHPYALISEDRKSISLKFPFSDYIERPEVLSFRVEY